MKSKGMKRLRVAFIAVFLLVLGGTAILCWLTPKKPALESGAACPPVRTALAMLALAENPKARTYAAWGSGAAAFTNVFNHAGLLACGTDDAVRADLVFVSGGNSRQSLTAARSRCATNGLLAVHFDVRAKTYAAFRRELEALPAGAWRLWFPGRSDCLVTMRPDAEGNKPATARVRLADILDLFAREGLFADLAHAGIGSVSSVFASYAGDRANALAVCRFAKGDVVPECFVTEEPEPFVWLDFSDVDREIRDIVLKEIWCALETRRTVLEGDILSRDGKMDAAMEKWTAAIKRNPDDPLILERICQLDVNAETFMKVGNFQMAAQCLETMVCLRPKDVQIARRLARVLQQAGRRELSAAVSKRADEMAREELKARGGKK